ncbi:MAG TPA: hypothetical protein VGB98_00030 [Pyrinomonadaceae bacterium]
MNSNTDVPDCLKTGPASELERLRIICERYTPEFILAASRTTESSAQTHEPEPALTSAAGGRFIAARDVLSTAGEVDELVRELRHILSPTHRDQADDVRERLLELWTAAERCLLGSEVAELRPAVLKRLFGEDDARANLSRDGQRQLGGNQTCQ